MSVMTHCTLIHLHALTFCFITLLTVHTIKRFNGESEMLLFCEPVF